MLRGDREDTAGSPSEAQPGGAPMAPPIGRAARAPTSSRWLYTHGHLLLLARVVQVYHTAGEAQLVLGQAQLLEGLLRIQAEILWGKSGSRLAETAPQPHGDCSTHTILHDQGAVAEPRGFLASGSSPVRWGTGQHSSGVTCPAATLPPKPHRGWPCRSPCTISRFSSPSEEIPTGMLGLVGSVTPSRHWPAPTQLTLARRWSASVQAGGPPPPDPLLPYPCLDCLRVLNLLLQKLHLLGLIVHPAAHSLAPPGPPAA